MKIRTLIIALLCLQGLAFGQTTVSKTAKWTWTWKTSSGTLCTGPCGFDVQRREKGTTAWTKLTSTAISAPALPSGATSVSASYGLTIDVGKSWEFIVSVSCAGVQSGQSNIASFELYAPAPVTDLQIVEGQPAAVASLDSSLGYTIMAKSGQMIPLHWTIDPAKLSTISAIRVRTISIVGSIATLGPTVNTYSWKANMGDAKSQKTSRFVVEALDLNGNASPPSNSVTVLVKP